jgi:hypothetical protein
MPVACLLDLKERTESKDEGAREQQKLAVAEASLIHQLEGK